jgi:hypothetical protein
MDKKPPLTEDERKQRRREASKRYAEKNREKVLAIKRDYAKRWLQDPENREKHREQNKRYYEKHGNKPLTEEQIQRKREANQRYQEEHAEEHRERSRRYAEAHREEVRERVKRWAASNPDKVKAYYERNKERNLERNRQWRVNNPEKHAAQQARQYKRHRNNRPLPGGLCDLCRHEETALARRDTGEKRALQQDHDHKTGTLRGRICLDCNRGLGAFKDDPELMRRAAEYVESYRPQPSTEETVELPGREDEVLSDYMREPD